MKKTVGELAGRWMTRRPEALTDVEHQVLQSAIERKPISKDASADFDDGQSLGARLADRIARVGGSWTFIISFVVFLVLWTVGNAWLLTRSAFDPYPFIFLNLVLSMIAALQAPVIMMSQNRQAERDRAAAEHDYAVNLKAEIEIMALHEKFDEIRHQEIILLREEIAAVREALGRIEAALGVQGGG
jgi:uncharacterized membrane protein